MPKIPQMGQARPMSMQVPSAPQPTGAGTRAIREGQRALAQGVSDVGAVFADLHKKRVLDRKQQFVKDSSYELDSMAQELKRDNSLKLRGKRWDDSANDSLTTIQRRYEEMLDAAPDSYAQNGLKQKYKQLFHRYEGEFLEAEHKGNALYGYNQFVGYREERLTNVHKSGSFDDASRYMKEEMVDIVQSNGLQFTNEQVQEFINKNKDYAQAAVLGALDSSDELANAGDYKGAEASLNNCMNFLEGKNPEHSELLNSLSAREKSSFLRKVQTAKKKHWQIGLQNLFGDLGKAEDIAASGLMSDPKRKAEAISSLQSTYAKANDPMADNATKEMIKERADKANMKMRLSNAENDYLKDGDFDEDQSMPEFSDGLNKQIYEKYLGGVAQKVHQGLYKDGADYVFERDGNIRNLSVMSVQSPQAYNQFKQQMNIIYDAHKIPDNKRTYITQTIKQHFGDTIKQSVSHKDPKSLAHTITNLGEVTGSDAFKVLDSLNIDRKFGAVLYVDPNERAEVASVLLNPPKGLQTLTPTDRKSLRVAMADDPMIQAMLAVGGGPNAANSAATTNLILDAAIDMHAYGKSTEEALNTFKHKFEPVNNANATVLLDKERLGKKLPEVVEALDNALEIGGFTEYFDLETDGVSLEDSDDFIESDAKFVSTSDGKLLLVSQDRGQPYFSAPDEDTGLRKPIMIEPEELAQFVEHKEIDMALREEKILQEAERMKQAGEDVSWVDKLREWKREKHANLHSRVKRRMELASGAERNAAEKAAIKRDIESVKKFASGVHTMLKEQQKAWGLMFKPRRGASPLQAIGIDIFKDWMDSRESENLKEE